MCAMASVVQKPTPEHIETGIKEKVNIFKLKCVRQVCLYNCNVQKAFKKEPECEYISKLHF